MDHVNDNISRYMRRTGYTPWKIKSNESNFKQQD
jgi:hypothetical protein